MKVTVLTSDHSSLRPGMTGEYPYNIRALQPEDEVPVTFTDIEHPNQTTNRSQRYSPTISMKVKQLNYG